MINYRILLVLLLLVNAIHPHASEFNLENPLNSINEAFHCPYQYQSVNVITGQYCENHTDLSIVGNPSIEFKRHYCSQDQIAQGWHFNFPNILFSKGAIPEEWAPESHSYTFDDKDRLIKIATLSPDQNSIYLDYSEKDLLTIDIETDDLQHLTYQFTPCQTSRAIHPYILSKYSDNKGYDVLYHYCEHPKERRLLLNRRDEPDGRYLITEYYDADINKVDEKAAAIPDPKRDPFIGKVKLQKAPLGIDQTPIVSNRFFYGPGYTEVYDAIGNKTLYHYGNLQKLVAVEHYWNETTLFRKEKLFWNSSGQMTSRAIEDGSGNIHVCYCYDYDIHNNVIKSTTWGNLSGSGKTPIPITFDGRPRDPAIEHYSTEYVYSKDGRHLLKEFNDNGLAIHYHYKDQLLVAKYTGEHNRIYKRIFYHYDDLGNCVKEIEDDGSSFFETDWSGVTERRYTNIELEYSGPAIGKPKVIEKGFTNLSCGQEILLLRIEFGYSCRGYVSRRALFDADSMLIDELTLDYDDQGRVICSIDSNGNELYREYDIHGNLLKERENEKEIRQTFDFANRLIKKETWVAGELKDSASYQYDYAGNRIASVDFYGNETRYQYDPLGRLVKTVHPKVLNSQEIPIRPVVEETFDIFNRVTCSINPNGYETTTEYNAYGKPTKIAYSDGGVETFEYNLDGSLRKKVSKVGVATFYSRDIFGRAVKEEYHDQQGEMIGEKTFSYTPFRLISMTDIDGCATTHTYDEAGREITIAKGDQYRVEFTYNAAGSVESKREWYGNKGDECVIEVFERDRQQEVVASSIHDVGGKVLRYREFADNTETSSQVHEDEKHYNSLGQNVLKRTDVDENGDLTITIFDAMLRPVKVEKMNSLGHLLTSKKIWYDPCGNKEKEAHAVLCNQEIISSYCIRWTWGPNNRLESVTEGYATSMPRTTTYKYNSAGLLVETVKPDLVSLSFQYHLNGRIKRITSSDHTIDYIYHYDEKGHLVEIFDHVMGKSNKRAYDHLGHLINETLANDLTLSSSYDYLGRLKKLTLPDQSEISWEYESTNLKKVTRYSEQGEALYSHQYLDYDLKGRLLASQMIHKLGNIEFDYNNGQMAAIRSPYWSQWTQFDDRNRLISSTTQESNGKFYHCYAYDSLNQLIREEGIDDRSFSYDSLGNPMTIDGKNCIVDPLNQLIETGSSTIKYDRNGQITEYQNANEHWFFNYDALGRLLGIKKKQDCLLSFTYDALGRRLSKTVSPYDQKQNSFVEGDSEFYIWEGENEIGAVNEKGEIKQLRVLGTGLGAEVGAAIAIEIEKMVYAPIHDHRGNIACLVNTATKQVMQSYHYTAFGTEITEAPETQSINNPWKFSSKRVDEETGLVYFGKRYYFPTIARWITKDPMGTPESVNRYAYSLNQPLTRVDPYGLFSLGDLWAHMGEFIGSVHHYFSSTLNLLKNHLSFENYVRPSVDNMAEILIGKTLLQLGGYYRDASENGVHGKGELNDKVRITLINGILNARIDYKKSLDYFSESHGGANIHYLFDATSGWCSDMIRAFFARFGVVSPVSHQLVAMWKNLIDDMGGVHGGGLIIHYAHSIGSTHTKNALKLLSPDERAIIRVYTFGSPSTVSDSGLESIKNFISYRDGIPLLDPIGFFSGLLGLSETIIMVGSPWGIPFVEHTLCGGAYSEIIRILGAHFIKHYTGNYPS